MGKSINPIGTSRIRGEAASGSAPSLIVLMSLRQLFRNFTAHDVEE